MRLFVLDGPTAAWSELNPKKDADGQPVVRLAASDLQRAQRHAARVRADQPGVAVVLDLHVTVIGDIRAVRDSDREAASIRYVGTVDGLTGLIADIELARVADGVTLIADGSGETSRQDVRRLGWDVLDRLALRGRATA